MVVNGFTEMLRKFYEVLTILLVSDNHSMKNALKIKYISPTENTNVF